MNKNIIFKTWDELDSEVIVNCPEEEGIIEFDGNRIEYFDDNSCKINGKESKIQFYYFGEDDVYKTDIPEDEGAFTIENKRVEYFNDGSYGIYVN